MSLEIVPVTLEVANDFVRRHHRHHKPTPGHKFSIGVARIEATACPEDPRLAEWASRLCGVVIVSRPVAAKLDDGETVEITRCCTDGTRNACSMLYGAARRAARSMGYKRVLTYTLPDEGGASLRAAGFRIDKEAAGGPSRWWHKPGRALRGAGG